MKILFSITKSTEGGAQTHVYQLCQYLKEKGHTCAIMAAPGGWLAEEAQKEAITFFPNPHFKNSYNPLLFVKNKKRINEVVQEFSPDLISTHSGFAGLMTRLVIQNRIPTIYTAHGWSFAPGVPYIQKTLTRVAERIAARYTEKIICVSEADKRLAQKYHIASKKKLTTIHNGVEIPSESPPPKTQIKDIVFVGRLAEPKQPEVLIELAQRLSAETRKDIHISIVGAGPKRALLEHLMDAYDVEDCVTLLGYMPREQVQAFLPTMDLFVLPSRKEGLPRSILEAQSHGLPAAASRVGGIAELISPHVGKLLAPGEETDELLTYITHMRKYPETFEKQSRAAHASAKSHFSLEDMCEKTYQVYQQVLSA